MRTAGHPTFYHDLQCRSGLGDRLLDLWAAATIARLHDPNGILDVRWHEGLQFASFLGNYSTDSFTIENCRFVNEPPGGSVTMDARFSHDEFNARGILPTAGEVRQLVLRTGMIWGNTYPEGLHADLAFYELDSFIPLEFVIDTYRAVAASTKPAPSILSSAPCDIETRIGIHIRLSDKYVINETSTDMSPETWRRIENSTIAYLECCIDNNKPLFVCSDDPAYKQALITYLRSKGGDVMVTENNPENILGSLALVEFFALSRCVKIVQMTKYSTFSLAAALVRGAPLVNFYKDITGVGHRLDIWRGSLRHVISA